MDISGALSYTIHIIINTVIDYLSINRLIALTISFLIAGAIVTMINRVFILKYFGPNTPKRISYLVASVSGCILAVCSCNTLPLFSSIYKKGGGLGPTTTLLFSGPAINILAVFYSAAVFGWMIGLLRAFYAITLSILIGLTMALLFERRNIKKEEKTVKEDVSNIFNKPKHQTIIFFLLLLLMLISITASPKFAPF